MPEASDPTPSEHEPRDNSAKHCCIEKEYGHEVAKEAKEIAEGSDHA